MFRVEIYLCLVDNVLHLTRLDVLGRALDVPFRYLAGNTFRFKIPCNRRTVAVRNKREDCAILRTFVSSANDSISDPIEIVALDSRESGV